MKSRLYKLSPWLIRALIPMGIKGTYILYVKKGSNLVPVYVGRSDTDLQRRLLNHSYFTVAHYFEYFHFDSLEKAFLSESSLFHCFEDTVLNEIHPATPHSSSIVCPYCTKNYHKTIKSRINLIS